MGTEAFEAPGKFWRGNIHTHSNRSDGALDPEEVCRRYREAGYDFLCLSDHFLERYGFPITDTRPYRTNSFTTIYGAEIHAPANSHGEVWHILAAGLPGDFAPTAVDEDGRAMAAHAHAVEIFNTSCAVECARPDGTYLLDQLLNEGHRLTAYAADDAHFRQPDAFAGWMMVKAEANEPEALVAAMKRGDVYSSQGPLIHEFSVDGDEVHVAFSPAANVALVGRGTRAVNLTAPQMSRATLPAEKFVGDWFRLVVADAAGKLAWTNPVWLD